MFSAFIAMLVTWIYLSWNSIVSFVTIMLICSVIYTILMGFAWVSDEIDIENKNRAKTCRELTEFETKAMNEGIANTAKYKKKFKNAMIMVCLILFARQAIPSQKNLGIIAVAGISAYTAEKIVTAPQVQKLITLIQLSADSALNDAIENVKQKEAPTK